MNAQIQGRKEMGPRGPRTNYVVSTQANQGKGQGGRASGSEGNGAGCWRLEAGSLWRGQQGRGLREGYSSCSTPCALPLSTSRCGCGYITNPNTNERVFRSTTYYIQLECRSWSPDHFWFKLILLLIWAKIWIQVQVGRGRRGTVVGEGVS